MYIKELEFINFKSFGKKVKIPFYDDFTTISGPNGSGKSNIIDGILFVLGLSSSRTLRAEKLTDLIYKDKNKKPDFAQVTIKFDNNDREMPVDTNEVIITRKIRETNSGYYSYFYFNGKAVSLTDIHNYLAKARVTPEGYNVVMQGDVTRIITMTPVERRKIIDEIAGVAEFDSKRDRALNELEIVKERVEKVDIILEEVGTQLEKLRNERDEALKYQALKQEKIKFEGFMLLSKLKEAKKELVIINEEINSHKKSLYDFKQDIENKRKRIEEYENTLEKINLKIQHMGEDEQIQIKKDIESILGEISRYQNMIDVTDTDSKDIDIRRRKAFVEIDIIKDKINDLNTKISEENIRLDTVKTEFSDKKTQRAILQSKIKDVDLKFAETHNKLSKFKNCLEKIKNEKNELIRNEDRLLDALRRKSAETVDIKNEMEDAQNKTKSSESDILIVKYEIEKLNEKINSLTKDIDDLESNRAQNKNVIKEIEDSLRKHQDDYARIEARVRAAEDHIRYSKAVDMIIKEKKYHSLPGIYGTIAELGSVDQKYSIALGIAAGGKMQAIVVDTDEDASYAIDFLKSHQAGRATFLPLNKMDKRRPYKNFDNHHGVIGYAIDLIDFDNKFESAFWYVFKDTLVVDTLQNARKLMGGTRIVTLEGELIEKSGAMIGGFIQKSGLSFAASEKDKLIKVAEKLTEFESKRNTVIKKLDLVESHIAEINREIHEHDKEISKKELQLEEIASRGDKLIQLLETKSSVLKTIEEESKQLRADMENVTKTINQKNEELENINVNINQLEQELSESEIPGLNKQAENIDNEIRHLESRIRDTEANINAINLDKEYSNNKMEENRELIKSLDEKKVNNRLHIEDLKKKIKESNIILTEKQKRDAQLIDELKEMQVSRTYIQNEYILFKKQYDNAKMKFEDNNRQMLAMTSTQLALQDQIDELSKEIIQRKIEENQEIPNFDALRTRINSIEKAMEKLEPVNMRAIEEFNEVMLRLDDLQIRRNTLFNEREQILSRLKQYEILKKNSFMQTYEGINTAFKEIFNELSDGIGELLLDDYEDPFNGGLTLKAQPKEKTLQRLEAMSGGEKSLTALSFVFAIQKYRPAPFYAFDEIDMFLDGVNAARVAQRVKKSVINAQFIVVSLRKPMIEAASRTIGVTMQENNITSITGVMFR